MKYFFFTFFVFINFNNWLYADEIGYEVKSNSYKNYDDYGYNASTSKQNSKYIQCVSQDTKTSLKVPFVNDEPKRKPIYIEALDMSVDYVPNVTLTFQNELIQKNSDASPYDRHRKGEVSRMVVRAHDWKESEINYDIFFYQKEHLTSSSWLAKDTEIPNVISKIGSGHLVLIEKRKGVSGPLLDRIYLLCPEFDI